MVKITAKFAGRDGSMGLKKGGEYDIKMYANCAWIMRNAEKIACPYQTIESFLRNWDNIKFISKK